MIGFQKKRISNKKLKELYYDILRPRMIEEKMLVLLRQGRISKWFSGIGQEAIAVGICHNLNNYDQIVSNHRCHAHYLAKGGDEKKMINEFYGNSNGCSGGRGGSMHLFDQKKGIVKSSEIDRIGKIIRFRRFVHEFIFFIIDCSID